MTLTIFPWPQKKIHLYFFFNNPNTFDLADIDAINMIVDTKRSDTINKILWALSLAQSLLKTRNAHISTKATNAHKAVRKRRVNEK